MLGVEQKRIRLVESAKKDDDGRQMVRGNWQYYIF
jgi:hypothetical protein